MGHRLEKANEIFETRGRNSFSQGELVVQALLDGRGEDDLSVEELSVLAKGYNWWGRHDESFRVISIALGKQPDDFELLRSAAIYIRNACSHTNSPLETYENFIKRQIGPSWFWRVERAREYYLIATGEAELFEGNFVWSEGDDILCPQVLEQAITELMKAIEECNPQAIDEVKKFVDEQPAVRQSLHFHGLTAKI